LKQANAVRFLNIMTELGSELNPITAAVSVGLKQGFLWNEETLKDFSENTIMREVRLQVVPCNKDTTVAGNIDYQWECTEFSGAYTYIHTVTQVTWVYDPSTNLYNARGTYTFNYKHTASGCTDTKTATGSIDNTGTLVTIDDLASQNALGFSYGAAGGLDAQVAAVYSCPPSSGTERFTVNWLPAIKGAPGSTSFSGKIVNDQACGGDANGTETIIWDFSVPPK
jgi:hypothetical protein